MAGAAVTGEDGSLALGEAFEAGAVAGGDDGQQALGLGFVENWGFPVDDFREGLGADFRKGHGPEDASLQGGDGLGDGIRVQPVRAEVLEVSRSDIFLDGDDEDPGA